MTVFGRDTLITRLQTMLFGLSCLQRPRGALRFAIARRRPVDRRGARQDRPRARRPRGGDLVPELLRDGRRNAAVPRSPLRDMALDRRRRAREALQEPALLALEWIDRYGDRDGDGFVEYERRTPRGLVNQSWKDSGDSQRFADGTLAEPPIAPAEVQGYVYDAKIRTAEVARDAWGDEGSRRGSRPRRPISAAASRRRSGSTNEADTSHSPRRGEAAGRLPLLEHGPPALERDRPRREGRRRRATAPRTRIVVGLGHPDDVGRGRRVQPELPQRHRLAARRPSPPGAWPVPAGTTRRGIARALFEAAGYFDWSLPEVFAGFSRDETPFPISYPTAARPQAWAAEHRCCCCGSCRARPDGDGGDLVSDLPAPVPDWVGSLALYVRTRPRTPLECHPRGRCRPRGGGPMRVAMLSPVWFLVPPALYGGIEWIVHLLADGLVEAGVDVTPASGDSRTLARLESVYPKAPSEQIGHSFWELRHAAAVWSRRGGTVRHRSRPPGCSASRSARAGPFRSSIPCTGRWRARPASFHEPICRMAPRGRTSSR